MMEKMSETMLKKDDKIEELKNLIKNSNEEKKVD